MINDLIGSYLPIFLLRAKLDPPLVIENYNDEKSVLTC